MGAAQKSTHLRVRRLPPADLGDGRDDPARQQAAAHRLVLGRLPDGDPLQRHLCPAAPETARYRLLPQRLAARPQAARQHGRPRAQPVLSGLVEIDEASLPFRTKDDPPTGGQGRSHDGKMLIVGAIELGDGNIPGRLRLAEISSYGAADLGHFVETAADPDAIAKTDGWSGYAAVPADRHNVHVVGKTAAHLVLPWIHQVFSNLKGWARGVYHGLRRKHLQAYLDEFVFRFNRRKTRHAAFRSLFRLATNAEPLTYSMLIEPEPCA